MVAKVQVTHMSTSTPFWQCPECGGAVYSDIAGYVDCLFRIYGGTRSLDYEVQVSMYLKEVRRDVDKSGDINWRAYNS